MGHAGPKAISKVNMILKDKKCNHGLLGNPLKKKAKEQKLDETRQRMVKSEAECLNNDHQPENPKLSEAEF